MRHFTLGNFLGIRGRGEIYKLAHRGAPFPPSFSRVTPLMYEPERVRRLVPLSGFHGVHKLCQRAMPHFEGFSWEFGDPSTKIHKTPSRPTSFGLDECDCLTSHECDHLAMSAIASLAMSASPSPRSARLT